MLSCILSHYDVAFFSWFKLLARHRSTTVDATPADHITRAALVVNTARRCLVHVGCLLAIAVLCGAVLAAATLTRAVEAILLTQVLTALGDLNVRTDVRETELSARADVT